MCFIGALKRSKYVQMKNMELTIKEMQMLEIQNIVVILARFTLRSIVYVIVFILNFASYT